MGLLTTHSPVQGLGGAFYRYQAPCHANANVPKGGSTRTVALGLGQTRAPGCCARRYCGNTSGNGPGKPTLAPTNSAGPPFHYRPSTEAGGLPIRLRICPTA